MTTRLARAITRPFPTCCAILTIATLSRIVAGDDDFVRDLQANAMSEGQSPLGHWGTDSENYTHWRTHSNRLIPVYTFGSRAAGDGVTLASYIGRNSPYRNADQLREIYGRVPERTLNPDAIWLDQTNIADIQRAAAKAGKKQIILIVFDGMDWNTTQAAAIYNNRSVTYASGKGDGTHFQTYKADGTAEFGFMVTSPDNDGTNVDVTNQTVNNPGGKTPGGYDAAAGGSAPWDSPSDVGYLIGKPKDGNVKHAYTDSASSATSMTTGHKTYNAAIGVDRNGAKLPAIAHDLQDEDWAVGIVSSVPISHATPASAYAHNVSRKDYQDISRDMLGLPSVSHPENPLPGLDVVIGGGYGTTAETGKSQGDNFESGNLYFADSDLEKSSANAGGRYVTAVRTAGKSGSKRLKNAAKRAVRDGHRLLGFYGVGKFNGHLPFQTANGDYKPVRGVKKTAEAYSEEDLHENPTVAEMTSAALSVLAARRPRFWLMVEAGDVDWANHDNNIDNSIGGVNSGDAAVKVVTRWVEENSSWKDALVIVTSDHGHLLQLTNPELLTGTSSVPAEDQ